jgi:hypothetical protein
VIFLTEDVVSDLVGYDVIMTSLSDKTSISIRDGQMKLTVQSKLASF